MKNIIKGIIVVLPWPIKRIFLQLFFGYELHPNSKIGFSWIYPDKLIMEKDSKIGHLNVAIHLHLIHLKAGATINRSNWITGFSIKNSSKHFQHQLNRNPQLILDEQSAITKQHHLDCTNSIYIGKYTTIAGYQSQFLTHSIDIEKGIQDSEPIKIGSYCFVGTNVVILGGAALPDYSVLGAKSLLNNKYLELYSFYGGVPAKFIKSLPKNSAYFLRNSGFVY